MLLFTQRCVVSGGPRQVTLPTRRSLWNLWSRRNGRNWLKFAELWLQNVSTTSPEPPDASGTSAAPCTSQEPGAASSLWMSLGLWDLQMKKMFLLRTTSRTLCSRPLPVLTLFTKDPCPLCDEAKEALEPLSHRFLLETVDISKPENRQFWVQYRYHIPVFHLNGSEIMRHRVDLERLERLLNQAQSN